MRRILRAFDALLARAVGVFEFTQDPGCILRLQRVTLRRPLALPGFGAAPGAPVVMLHLWNSRIPPLPEGGADVVWARAVARALLRSLRLARSYILHEIPAPGPQAIGAVTVLGAASGTADLLARIGFVPRPCPCPLGSFGAWWENAYTWCLMWAYNPASLRGKRLSRLRRAEYWMSAHDFLERFASP